jgi:hypothetical protein
VFKGGYDPDGAQSWVRGVEKIFKTNDDTTVVAVSLKEDMTITSGLFVDGHDVGLESIWVGIEDSWDK